jgi:peroxiredoxin
VQDSDRRVELSNFKGKVIVLNFWATWCPPCVEEMPSLEVMQTRLQGHVEVLGVSIDQDGDAYQRFLKEHGINFLTVRDPEQKSSELYGTHGWPETYIIDERGIVRRKFIGPVDWTSPDVIAYLQGL